MSFAFTTAQFRDRTKTVTRRRGWWFLKSGDIVCGVEKARGLRKGEKIQRLGLIRIVSTQKEPLNAITAGELDLEGMPGTTPGEFVAWFCRRYRVPANEPVNRIAFEYLDER